MSETNGTALSPRQSQVLAMVQADKTTAEIASAMGITTQGVHGHVRRLRERGYLPEAPARKTAARKAPSMDDALEPLRTVIERQIEQLQRQDARLMEELERIAQEQDAIAAERGEVHAAIGRLMGLRDQVAANEEATTSVAG